MQRRSERTTIGGFESRDFDNHDDYYAMSWRIRNLKERRINECINGGVMVEMVERDDVVLLPRVLLVLTLFTARNCNKFLLNLLPIALQFHNWRHLMILSWVGLYQC